MLDEKSNGAVLDFLEEFGISASERVAAGIGRYERRGLSESRDRRISHGGQRDDKQADEQPAEPALHGQGLGTRNLSQECGGEGIAIAAVRGAKRRRFSVDG
jgi:hypothetical protein